MKYATLFPICTALCFARIATADDLELHCTGDGVVNESENTTAYSRDSDKNRQVTTVQSHSKRPFNGVVNVKLTLGAAKIRVPAAMHPKVSSGKDGWLDIDDLKMNEDEISGSFKFNFANRPKFRVDRRTGEISVSGVGAEFNGQCEKIDADSKPKF